MAPADSVREARPGLPKSLSVEAWLNLWNETGPSYTIWLVLALLFALALAVGLATWWVRRRAQKLRAVPYYWENYGASMRHAEDKFHKDFFDESFPLPVETRGGLQELLNETCEREDKAFRLAHARRVESSALWVRYRRRLREVLGRREPCEFQGDGEPRIRRAVEHLDLPELAPFSHRDMAADACEVFLWLGTKPETALKIMNCGELLDDTETVGRNARFGVGWYFAEDVSVAHESAQPGEHLYRECYAMLLCRVVLGRQRLVVEGPAGSPAAPRIEGDDFDSVLVELPGEPRQFVVRESSQVYPEYALVYEQCSPDTLEHGLDAPTYWEHARTSVFGTIYPPYWVNCRSDASDFHDMFPAMFFKSVLQEIADKTWKHKWTRDRRGRDGKPIPKGDPNGDMPSGIRVLAGWRFEDDKLWRRYHQYRERVLRQRGQCRELNIKTTSSMQSRARRRLCTEANEAYVWHGSSPRAVMGIASEGFNLDLTGSNVGAMFGRGAYLAESSSKADEYGHDDREGFFAGCFAMLLCRAVIGEPQVLQAADPRAHEHLGLDRAFDSTVGDRESAVGTYREFVVPSADAIYPEYAIIYERLYPASRPRGRTRACAVQTADEDTKVTGLLADLP